MTCKLPNQPKNFTTEVSFETALTKFRKANSHFGIARTLLMKAEWAISEYRFEEEDLK